MALSPAASGSIAERPFPTDVIRCETGAHVPRAGPEVPLFQEKET